MFKIIWDKEHNGIKLTMRPGDEALNVSPRPVFYEELDNLGLDEAGWTYPKTKEPLLWACERRYFYKGVLVLEVKGGNVYDEPKVEITPNGKNLFLTPVDMQQLRKENQETMFLLEHEAMDFIDSTYRKYKNIKRVAAKNPQIDFQTLAAHQTKRTKKEHVVVREDCDSFDVMPLSEAEKEGKQPVLSSKIDMFISSFSGGKDSEVLLDLVSRVVPEDDLIVIYSNTGYELPTSLNHYQEIREYYKDKYPHLKFYTASNHQPVLHYWDVIGAPSRIHRWCCSVMKSAPLSKKLKEIKGDGKQPHAILFDGVRAEESPSRSNRSKIGKNVKHTNIINVSPLLEWNSTEIYLYIMLRNLPINEAYRKGLSRVGCVLCPYFSGWSENMCGLLFKDTMKPFINKLENILTEAKVSGVKNYIKKGKWKMRAGGRDVKNSSSVNFISASPDFKAIIKNPQEELLTWLKVLGELTIRTEDNVHYCTFRYKKKIYNICITENRDNTVIIDVKNIGDDVIFISHLKKVIYKATYCSHCEVCEVDCPSGALSVVPYVTVDEKKCIHCFKCMDFNYKGCITADSVNISTGENNNMNNVSMKSGINRYNDGMGLRKIWLDKYFKNPEHFFDDDSHGLNPKYQIPPFINWLKESEIINKENKQESELGRLLEAKYHEEPNKVWEIIFINLCYNSEICKWFYSHINFENNYTQQELFAILQDSYPDLKDRTLKNPLHSLINTFKESPLGSEVPVGRIITVNRKPIINRKAFTDVSLVAIAYSLYKYAEHQERHDLTVSEFYNENQTDGIYRQFGIDKESLEKKLRTLQEEGHHVLSADLNMGLDNINLRDDLTSLDILKMLL